MVSVVKEKLDLWPLEPVRREDRIRYGVRLEGCNLPESFWIEVPEAYERQDLSRLDAFVVALLYVAMKEGKDLRVHGTVAPSLLNRLEEFQLIWTCWRPGTYKKVDIIPECEAEASHTSRQRGALAAFSGGVDSCFTIFQHHYQKNGRLNRKIQGGLMIHGLDIPLSQPDMFRTAMEGSRRILDSVGIPLVSAATNYRSIVPDWESVFGAALSSSMMLFDEYYDAGLIGSGNTYRKMHPWGSTPLTDRLLSSDSFETVHDGATHDRCAKVQAIADWRAARENLRVCWQGEKKDRNCGRCEKCVRTILNYRLYGHRLPECFEQDVTDRQISGLRGMKPVQIDNLSQIVERARNIGVTGSWVAAAAQAVAINSRELSGFGRRLRQMLKVSEYCKNNGPRRTLNLIRNHVKSS